jgi:hypothetical protein
MIPTLSKRPLNLFRLRLGRQPSMCVQVQRVGDTHRNPENGTVSRLPRPIRRSLVVAAAAVLLVAGALMLVLPGPGLLLIGAALALLAGEFPSVRDRLQWAATIAAALHARAERVIRFGRRPYTGG